MRRKRMNVQIGPFPEKKADDQRAPINITVGAFLPGHRFKDESPRGIMNAVKKSLISFVIAVILFVIISNLISILQ